MERYTRCGLLLFEVWSTDKQHQQYLGACKKKKKENQNLGLHPRLTQSEIIL